MIRNRGGEGRGANVAVIIFTPIFLPLAHVAGLTTIQFGIIMCINLCIGLLTPPVGLCLLLGNNIAEGNFKKSFRETLPFILIGIIVLLMVAFIPSLIL